MNSWILELECYKNNWLDGVGLLTLLCEGTLIGYSISREVNFVFYLVNLNPASP
jgi:hypothetical protein